MSITSVQEAENIVLKHTIDFGVEHVPFTGAQGRVLAVDIVTDRCLPPYDRVTMDGIAISYSAFQKGLRTFRIEAVMAAGDKPVETKHEDECIELMTGCALPATTDTVIRYEDLNIKDGFATITIDAINQGANIHRKGCDKQQGVTVVAANTIVDATVISMAASVGQTMLAVKKLPRIVIISTGDELVDVHVSPSPFQIRRSNSYAIQAVLRQNCIEAEMLHITDEPQTTKDKIIECLKAFDVIILSGGVSMGRFDYVPQALEETGVKKLFHKVQQRPGKPFWFGKHSATASVVFAFPGNPVSAFLCLHRYLIPWLSPTLGKVAHPNLRAILMDDFTFLPPLQYFLQVHVRVDEESRLVAVPVEGNGSGDFTNLLAANAFMELPAEISNFKKGDQYMVWPFKPLM
jgi:molybdopterin molybdotransferase